ncbi:hypothetical protein [Nakamurella leprariae]|uniref:DUF4352 domain-containing protein n=1 Tax=Nakamurella leprariae TaxID=2803911 RepID=A0A938YAG0_9ACTN|nr:hypothetical protein [Nakamurella leprariae]MBM9466982.1 hypothetical protein [Nakamurella leprariae]
MVAALALAATATACATTPGQAVLASPGWGAESTETSRTTPTTSTRSTPTTSSTTTSTPTSTTAGFADDAVTVAFDETIQWTDGLSVSVTAPAAYTPSDSAVGSEDAAAAVRVTIKVVNNSAVVWDPGYSRVVATAAGAELEDIYDTANGITQLPYTQVLPGHELWFAFGFALADTDDAEDLQVAVSLGYDYDDGVFSTTATGGPDRTARAGEPSSEYLPVVEAFGTPFEWENGLSVAVSAPAPFTPTESAVGDEGPGEAVRVDVTVTNGSQEEFDPYLLFVTALSGKLEATEIFDGAGGLESTPYTAVAPGATVTFPIGFKVADPADLVVQVSPGSDYEPALFTG